MDNTDFYCFLIKTISGQNINKMAIVEAVVEEADKDGANEAGLGVKLNAVRYKNGMYNNSASSGW